MLLSGEHAHRTTHILLIGRLAGLLVVCAYEQDTATRSCRSSMQPVWLYRLSCYTRKGKTRLLQAGGKLSTKKLCMRRTRSGPQTSHTHRRYCTARQQFTCCNRVLYRQSLPLTDMSCKLGSACFLYVQNLLHKQVQTQACIKHTHREAVLLCYAKNADSDVCRADADPWHSNATLMH